MGLPSDRLCESDGGTFHRPRRDNRVSMSEMNEQTCIAIYHTMLNRMHDQLEDYLKSIKPNIFFLLRSASREHYGLRPLHLACVLNDMKAIIIILRAGAEIDEECWFGDTALNISCKYGHIDCVRKLIDCGARVNKKLSLLQNGFALLSACAYDEDSERVNIYLEIVHLLLRQGARLDMADDEGITALHMAVTKRKSVELTKILLSAGANVNSCHSQGDTPLIRAVRYGRSQQVAWLMIHGSNIDFCSAKAGTALQVAVSLNDIGMTNKLMLFGADIDVTDENRPPPLMLACIPDRLFILELLLSQGGNPDAAFAVDGCSLINAMARRLCLPGVKLLVKYGANINSETKLGTTPLWTAVKLKHRKLFKYLIYIGCDVNISSLEVNLYGPQTAIQLALRHDLPAQTRVLLDAGSGLLRNWLQFVRTPDRTDAAVQVAEHWMCTAHSLRYHARLVIRKYLGPYIHKKVHQLEIPRTLIDYILLTEELSVL